ncbi:hypothetical protein [Thiolapillus sp.]|uniref:hypothetical protein n=1 Tax=Thiolapillus sp. TaxID=2017437 RepID=UPI0025D6232B|nr:hypothetical protein [Thiolapillus sp.]
MNTSGRRSIPLFTPAFCARYFVVHGRVKRKAALINITKVITKRAGCINRCASGRIKPTPLAAGYFLLRWAFLIGENHPAIVIDDQVTPFKVFL